MRERKGVKTVCRTGVQNEAEGCPKCGTATDRTDKTDWGEIQDTHKSYRPYKSYRPHENAVQAWCPK